MTGAVRQRGVQARVGAVAARPRGRHARSRAASHGARLTPVFYQTRSEPMPRGHHARPISDGVRSASPSARLRGALQKASAVPAVVNFAAGGAIIAVLGALILEALVRVGAAPLAAQAVQLAITLALNFAYNSKITWRDRPRTGLRRQAAWFLATRAATQAASWFGFALLTALGLHYQLANAACLGATMAINFVTSDKLVFRGEEATRHKQPAFRRMWNGSGLHNSPNVLKPRSSGAE
jgi:putative flippase GtrA